MLNHICFTGLAYRARSSAMFRPSKILSEAFVKRVTGNYRKCFGEGPPGHLETLTLSARMSMSRLARTNALYHNLDHTMMVALVGEDIIRGRLYRDGDVRSIDWLHFMVSLFSFGLGFTRRLCREDAGSTCVIDAEGNTTTLPHGATDGMLWPHFTDRSKIFLREHYHDHPILDPDVLAEQVEYSRFPPPPGEVQATQTYPGLLRAAQVIGAIADPDFSLKMTRLWLEMDECGLSGPMGFSTANVLRKNYPQFFWTMLHPLIPGGMELLTYTGSGRLWLANMHAHVLLEEHRTPPASLADATRDNAA
jgi:hypothetical protein